RTDAQHADSTTRAQLTLRLVSEAKKTLRIGQQQFTFRRQYQAASLLSEERSAEALLQLLDTRGDVRLHAVQFLRRSDHAAFHRHRAKDVEAIQVDTSHGENDAPYLFICAILECWL